MNSDKKKALQLLKTCRGQVEATIKMLEDERYCIDVSNQIIAAQGLLKKANKLILTQHMHTCLKDAVNNEGEKDQKIEEVVDIVSKLIDK
ncbi:metal-sensing transcriptional repressor [Clostridium paraputrificum]|uniref:metal-sensing transcriptional repressor n=1 Tax=Clostridium TaxID=1485 RepID=UPI003D32FC7D